MAGDKIRRAAELYEGGRSLREVASELGTSHPTARKWLLRSGVERRSLSAARRASYDRMRLALQGTVPPGPGRPWTATEDQMLINGHGQSAGEIAAQIGRTEEAVTHRRVRLRKAGKLSDACSTCGRRHRAGTPPWLKRAVELYEGGRGADEAQREGLPCRRVSEVLADEGIEASGATVWFWLGHEGVTRAHELRYPK